MHVFVHTVDTFCLHVLVHTSVILFFSCSLLCIAFVGFSCILRSCVFCVLFSSCFLLVVRFIMMICFICIYRERYMFWFSLSSYVYAGLASVWSKEDREHYRRSRHRYPNACSAWYPQQPSSQTAHWHRTIQYDLWICRAIPPQSCMIDSDMPKQAQHPSNLKHGSNFQGRSSKARCWQNELVSNSCRRTRGHLCAV